MSKSLTVLHSFPLWLPQTQTWMYNQIRFLPGDVSSHVVCRKTWNLDQFRIPNLHCYADSSLATLLPAAMRRGAAIVSSQRVIGYPFRRIDVASFLAYQRFLIERIQPDVIHSHFGTVAWQNLAALTGTGLPHVVTFYGFDVNMIPRKHPRWRRRYRELFRRIDGVLCEGPHMGQALVELGCPSRKVTVHHLGIDLDAVPFRPRVKDRDEPLRVLIVGSFREKKGIPDALAAVGQIAHRIPIEVTIIGDASDDGRCDDEKRRILEMVRRYKLEARVRFLGYQPYARVLQEAYEHHVFLSPSVEGSDGDTEGGAPVTIIEMLASGMPVVSTTHCDIPHVIHHGESGLLAEEHDVSALAAHLAWLADNPERWRDMAEAGRRRVDEEFNAGAQGARLGGLYAQHASERSRTRKGRSSTTT